MATGWKKTTKRTSCVLRILAQIRRASSEHMPILVNFLYQLWELADRNDSISFDIRKTDGFVVKHDNKEVFYMHIDRKEWALLMFKNSDILAHDDKFQREFKEKREIPSSIYPYDQKYRIKDKNEFDYIIAVVRKLKNS
jgi:hypothetical protein